MNRAVIEQEKDRIETRVLPTDLPRIQNGGCLLTQTNNGKRELVREGEETNPFDAILNMSNKGTAGSAGSGAAPRGEKHDAFASLWVPRKTSGLQTLVSLSTRDAVKPVEEVLSSTGVQEEAERKKDDAGGKTVEGANGCSNKDGPQGQDEGARQVMIAAENESDGDPLESW